MYNANGYAEPKRLILGLGDLYVNDQYVGNLKGAVTFNVTRSMAYQRPGNLVSDLKAEVTGEEVSLSAEVCDLKLEQLRIALGINNESQNASRNFKTREVIQLTGTTPVALTKTAVGTIKVMKLDRSETYTITTDYTFATNEVTRVALGSIADGEHVIVEYEFTNADAKVLGFGGETLCPREFLLDYSIKGCEGATGKLWQLRMFRAIVPSEFEIAFNERASGDFTVHNVSFRALVDITKPEGRNLYEWFEEDGAL